MFSCIAVFLTIKKHVSYKVRMKRFFKSKFVQHFKVIECYRNTDVVMFMFVNFEFSRPSLFALIQYKSNKNRTHTFIPTNVYYATNNKCRFDCVSFNSFVLPLFALYQNINKVKKVPKKTIINYIVKT